MRIVRPVFWLLTLGFVLAPGFGITANAQKTSTCMTTSRKETHYNRKGKVDYQKIEVRAVAPNLVVAQYSVASKKPVKLKQFWKLRTKACLACEKYFEKIEERQAQEEREAEKDRQGQDENEETSSEPDSDGSAFR